LFKKIALKDLQKRVAGAGKGHLWIVKFDIFVLVFE